MANRIALVTGASRGIGAAVAKGLAEDGFHVGLIARSKLDDVAKAIRSHGAHAHPFHVEVENADSVQKAIAELLKQEGRIDLLVNNAGMYAQGDIDLPEEDFEKILHVNLLGAVHTLRAVVPVMKKQKSGMIVNIASICGKVGFAKIGAYTASKFGLVGLSESLFRELAPLGIRVTTICPSWVNTQMAAHAPFGGEKMIQPGDILQTIRFLQGLGPQASVREIVIDCTSDLS